MIDLVLPWPPSTNAMWRTVVIKGAGRTLLSADGREYRETVHRVVRRLWSTHFPLSCRLAVSIRACPPDRRRRDLDNILKGALDALTRAGVWQDDSLIDELRVIRGDLAEGGLLYVSIAEMPAAQPALDLPSRARALVFDPLSPAALSA